MLSRPNGSYHRSDSSCLVRKVAQARAACLTYQTHNGFSNRILSYIIERRILHVGDRCRFRPQVQVKSRYPARQQIC